VNSENTQLVPLRTSSITLNLKSAAISILQNTPNAHFAAEEFFKATINNEHTRRAYARIVGRLLSWCETNGIELPKLTPGLPGEYLSSVKAPRPRRTRHSRRSAISSMRW
jgi:hypothetical protein